MTVSSMLQLDHLNFHYPNRRLINDLSASLPPGVTIVRGGDGCGKTSLLRLIAGQAAPPQATVSGSVALDGIPQDRQTEAYQRQLYYVDPRTEAFDQLRVPEFFSQMRQRHAAFDSDALPALIEGLALAPHLEKQLFMLSTGSKRKVYLAAAFAANAALTLLDDPFAALDQASVNFVCKTLNTLTTRTDTRPDTRQVWLASFYEVPAAIVAAGLIDLGD